MINNPTVWIVLILAVTLLGIGKAGFGGGAGLLSIPLIGTVMPIGDAVLLILLMLITIDWFMFPHYRHHFHKPTVKQMLIGAVFGIAIGVATFQMFAENDRILRIFIGIISLVYVGMRVGGVLDPEKLKNSRFLSPMGYFLGGLSGFMSTIANAGGPPATMYILSRGIEKVQFVGTMAIFIIVVNHIKLASFAILGFYQDIELLFVLGMLPVCFLGVRLGIFLNGRIPQHRFNQVIYTLLTLTGIQLVIGTSIFNLLTSG